MAEDPKARPVSGEIMTGEGALASLRPAAIDVVDAEFETVHGARAAPTPPELRRVVAAPDMIGTTAAPFAGLDMLKGGAAPEPGPLKSRGGPAFWIFGLAVACGAFWVSGGHALVSQPDAVSTAAPQGTLRIEGLTSKVENAGDRAVLLIDGEAVNGTRQSTVVPPLEISVTAASGRVTRYKLGTSSRELAPGARFGFSSRLEAPKDGVTSVKVDFSEIE